VQESLKLFYGDAVEMDGVLVGQALHFMGAPILGHSKHGGEDGRVLLEWMPVHAIELAVDLRCRDQRTLLDEQSSGRTRKITRSALAPSATLGK
jgi:hypothetical protein